MASYVLVHGGGHGGWCWQRVARLLRAEGHEVHTPTLTGLGERGHLLTPDVGLATHIADVSNLLTHEDLREVILVGHSYGGVVIAGVAGRVPDRIGQLVYLDAAVIEDGESLAGNTPALMDLHAAQSRVIDGVDLVLWPEDAASRAIYGIEDDADWAWMLPRLRPHPWRTMTDRLQVADPGAAAKIPKTMINCRGTLAKREGEACGATSPVIASGKSTPGTI